MQTTQAAFTDAVETLAADRELAVLNAATYSNVGTWSFDRGLFNIVAAVHYDFQSGGRVTLLGVEGPAPATWAASRNGPSQLRYQADGPKDYPGALAWLAWLLDLNRPRRTITVAGVELEAWPEHGCWYEVGKADQIGAAYAPMDASGILPTAEDVGEVEVTYADA